MNAPAKNVLVSVTDYGTVKIPPKVAMRYREVYFKKRAPKKSERLAMEALHSDVSAMMRYSWLMGRTEPKW